MQHSTLGHPPPYSLPTILEQAQGVHLHCIMETVGGVLVSSVLLGNTFSRNLI